MIPRIRRRSLPDIDGSGFDGLPPLLARLYRLRGLRSADDNRLDLHGLPTPASLKGIDQAVALLAEALADGQRILLIGDYDADGATSTALAVLGLRSMGATAVDYLLPDRFRYGYGLSPAIVELAVARRPDLLLTVDNGIASHAGVEAARARGWRVIVTDHHLPAATLPAADAIVNPNQPGCDFPSRNLAGVGVLFYVLLALRAELRARGWFVQRGLAEPNLAVFLDLVALGTVADVVPLDHCNRILVEQGLRRIRAGQCRPGITALLEIGQRDPAQAVARDLGFAAGPRLNAAGRLADMSEGVRCLLEDDPQQARALAVDLDAKNRERREIEAGMCDDASVLLDGDPATLPWGLAVFEPHWHQGVVGILASRLKERFHRPVIAFAPGESGELKGSGRSIPGFHLRDALDAVATAHPGLIERFGGHAMAAGLSIAEHRFAEFAAAFDAQARQWLSADELTAVLWSDGALAAGEFTLANARLLRQAGPWGQKFPEPLFDGEFLVCERRVVKERHLKLQLALPDDGPRFEAIWFNADLDRVREGQRVQAAYRLDANEFRGRESLQLQIETLR